MYDDVMAENVGELHDAVVGHKIVSAENQRLTNRYGSVQDGLVITLDNGKQVVLRDTDDCCAHTYLDTFLLDPNRIDHIITGVDSSDGYTKWHIFADLEDILTLTVSWSEGSGYYGYGFDIEVRDIDV